MQPTQNQPQQIKDCITTSRSNMKIIPALSLYTGQILARYSLVGVADEEELERLYQELEAASRSLHTSGVRGALVEQPNGTFVNVNDQWTFVIEGHPDKFTFYIHKSRLMQVNV